MSFKFGVMDKVKIIKNGMDNNVKEDNGGLEMIAIIVECISSWQNGHDAFVYKLRSKEFKKRDYWWFEESYLELVNTESKAQMHSGKWNTKCSRCGSPAYTGLNSIECSGGCK